MTNLQEKPWYGKVPHDLSNKDLSALLEHIAFEADKETPDRKISAVGLADILMAAADRIENV